VLGLFSELFVNFALGGIFQDEVDLFLVPEEPIESTHIFVPKMALNLNLSPELMLNLGADQLLLVQYLERNNELGPLLSRQVDMPELSSSHWLSDLKVVDGPLFRIELSWLLLIHFNLLIIKILDLDRWGLIHFGHRHHVDI
jgi:hypothetical protein